MAAAPPMVVLTTDDNQAIDTNLLVKDVRERIQQAREDRKRMEPTWQSNLAFAAGKFWLQWDRFRRQLTMPSYLYGKDLYSADIITEYRTTALGELSSDDDMPELLLRREDEASEDFQEQLNKSLEFAWDHEAKAQEALDAADRLCLDLGTSAIQCYFDADQGPVVGEIPHVGGRPVHGQQDQYDLFADGPNANVRMLPQRQGRICWRPLSAFNLLVPPGIPDSADFPWECVVHPVPLTTIQSMYADGPFAGNVAALKEDSDIASLLGMDTTVTQTLGGIGGPNAGASSTGRVRGHAWVFTFFERATPRYPEGRVVTLAGNKMTPVAITPRLPYQAPDGTFRSGLHYFHWWRVSGRFMSRGLVEVMKDQQRAINRISTDQIEITKRGMPFVLTEEGAGLENRKGLPLEVLELKRQGAGQPIIHPGVGPGTWMQAQKEAIREDLEHATGIHGPRIGENPANVTTYSQLALIAENDQSKRSHIFRARRLSIARLVEDTVYDMRTYWGAQKHIDLAGDDGRVDATIFNATKIPAFYIVKVAKGAVKPRNQAAELAKVEQLWDAALQAQIVLANPQAWMEWYRNSLEAGQALPLPNATSDDQTEKALLENHLLLEGQLVTPDYFDPPDVHIPIHRSAQIQARLSGDQRAWQVIDQHVKLHEVAAQLNIQQITGPMQQAAAAQMPPPGAPAGPTPEQQFAGNQEARTQELHQQQVRKASAEATLAEKKATQGPPPHNPQEKRNG